MNRLRPRTRPGKTRCSMRGWPSASRLPLWRNGRRGLAKSCEPQFVESAAEEPCREATLLLHGHDDALAARSAIAELSADGAPDAVDLERDGESRGVARIGPAGEDAQPVAGVEGTVFDER